MHKPVSAKRLILLTVLLLLAVFTMRTLLTLPGKNLFNHETATPVDQAEEPVITGNDKKIKDLIADGPKVHKTDKKLEMLIADWAKKQQADYSVAVREFGGQKRMAYYRSDEQMVPASLYKLFLIYTVLSEVEQGQLALNKRLPSGVTIDECIESLLVISSDDCAWELGSTIGWSAIDKFLNTQGYNSTEINNYNSPGDFIKDKLTTARDTEKLLTGLEGGELLNDKHSRYMLGFMLNQVHRERIPAGVPKEVEVADKPGWLKGIENDAAIVRAPSAKYVLVILSVNGASPDKLAQLSGLIYNHMTFAR